MAQELNHLPHIRNMEAGINKWDPVHKQIFEVYFELPPALQEISQLQSDSGFILTHQVINVSGLDALQKTTTAGEQKFYGTTVSFLNPTVDTTAADITITYNMNLRNVTDNYVLKIFRAWEDLSYDLQTGARGIKTDYISDKIRIAEANRNGQIWRSYIFHHVMLTAVTGLEDLDYSSNDTRQLTTTFRCDFWDDEIA